MNCFLDTTAKAICMVRDIDLPNIGITIDVGHALIAGENPAESLCMLESHGIPYYVHINDNNKKWDWDLIAGTRNLWEYLEFFYYLKKFNYNGWVTADMSPIRLNDRVEAFEQNIRFTDRVVRIVESLDDEKIKKLQKENHTVKTLRYLEDMVLK